MQGGNSITHTCNDESPWWEVDLGLGEQFVISSVLLFNRWDDCCRKQLSGSEIQVLDDSNAVVASRWIAADDVSSVYRLDFDNVQGRYVRVKGRAFVGLNIAEAEIMGRIMG